MGVTVNDRIRRVAKEIVVGEKVVGKLEVKVALDLHALCFALLWEAVCKVLPIDPSAVVEDVL